MVKAAAKKKNTDDLKEKIQEYSKLEKIKTEKNGDIKDYIKDMSMSDARMNFRLRTRMFNCKMNFMSDPANTSDLWRCEACQNIDTQAHILWCLEYRHLREGKSIKMIMM